MDRMISALSMVSEIKHFTAEVLMELNPTKYKSFQISILESATVEFEYEVLRGKQNAS